MKIFVFSLLTASLIFLASSTPVFADTYKSAPICASQQKTVCKGKIVDDFLRGIKKWECQDSTRFCCNPSDPFCKPNNKISNPFDEAVYLNDADFVAATTRGEVFSPTTCGGGYAYSPSEGVCYTVNSFTFTRDTCSGDKVSTDNYCCIFNGPLCAHVLTCADATATPACFRGYIDCESRLYNKSVLPNGQIQCTPNKDKFKAAGIVSEFFTGTDFEGVCPRSSDGINYVDTAIGCIPTKDFTATVGFVLRWLFLAAGGIIIALVIKNGFTLLTSAGNPEKLKEVKESVTAIVTGVILIIFSLTILRIVGADVLGLPGF